MAADRERRSPQARAGASGDQVGGRQPELAVLAGGGGYQGNRTSAHVASGLAEIRDPRLAELEKMGLARVHLQLAALIGFEAFMVVWQHYDADASCRTEKGDIEVRMRPYRSYLRFQRNRFIEALLAEGMKPAAVRARLRADLREEISTGHISKIGRKGRIKP